MDRLEQIKKSLEDAKMDSLIFGQRLRDMEWLIEQAERVKKCEEDVEIRKRHEKIVRQANREYQKALNTINDELEKLTSRLKNMSDEHLTFSQGLWDGGDKINAQYQEGRGTGLAYALNGIESILKKL